MVRPTFHNRLRSLGPMSWKWTVAMPEFPRNTAIATRMFQHVGRIACHAVRLIHSGSARSPPRPPAGGGPGGGLGVQRPERTGARGTVGQGVEDGAPLAARRPRWRHTPRRGGDLPPAGRWSAFSSRGWPTAVWMLARPVRREPADRVWFAALSALIPRRRWAQVFPVTPATLLARHRGPTARKWGYSKRRIRPGRPPTAGAVKALVLRPAKENPRWGCRRIQGDRLGHPVGSTTGSGRSSLRRASIQPRTAVGRRGASS
jgi:hypothetical protein